MGPKKIESKTIFDPQILGPTKISGPKMFKGPKRLVKIGSVTAEIMLIRTIVARTYVACTNVTTTVGKDIRKAKDELDQAQV